MRQTQVKKATSKDDVIERHVSDNAVGVVVTELVQVCRGSLEGNSKARQWLCI